MWAQRDEFQFVWKRMTGDFILQARVEFLGKGVEPHRKAGWMIRPRLDADAPYVDGVRPRRRPDVAAVPPDEGRDHRADRVGRQGRRRHPARAQGRHLHLVGGEVRRAVHDRRDRRPRPGRRGATSAWRCARTTRTSPSARSSATSGSSARRRTASCRIATTSAACSRSSTSRPATAQIVHRSAQPFEAPNWTPDGNALIYNTSGRAEGWGGLYRFDLATRQSTLIDTGVANRNNNDHVLSFDGTMLGISDQSPASSGRSTIYTVPVAGGTPKRITTLAPSYLHSWSPDGKSLIFTGGRNNEFDIYRIPADGSGPEVKLTDYKGLDDGPEYTPDGQYIYFNSVRSGHDADLADGAGRQRSRSRSPTTSSTTGSRTSRRTASRS